MTLKKISAAGIDFLQIKPLSSPEKPGRCFVVLHGYGASFNDLVPLKQFIPSGSEDTWYFANGTLPLIFNGMEAGRAWFELSLDFVLQRTRSEGIDALGDYYAPKLNAISSQLRLAFNELKIDPSQLVLMGFSQGAMVATAVSLDLERTPKGLIAFSGAPADAKGWSEKLPNHPSLKIFQSHGRSDMVLPFFFGEGLAKLFKKSGNVFEFRAFDGGHEIPPSILDKANRFVANL